MEKGALFETQIFTIAIEEGIFHIRTKPVPLTLEIIEESIEVLEGLKKENKLLLFFIPGRLAPIFSKERALFVSSFNEFVEAVAVLNTGPEIPIIEKFFKINKPEYEVKLFEKQTEALEWLETFKG